MMILHCHAAPCRSIQHYNNIDSAIALRSTQNDDGERNTQNDGGGGIMDSAPAFHSAQNDSGVLSCCALSQHPEN